MTNHTETNGLLRSIDDGAWELLVDAPTIPASRNANPTHAIAGDVLREDHDDEDLTPFRLYRGKRRIGSPEWWQVRHLFDGLRLPGDPTPAPARMNWPRLEALTLLSGQAGLVLWNRPKTWSERQPPEGALITPATYRANKWNAPWTAQAPDGDRSWSEPFFPVYNRELDELRAMSNATAEVREALGSFKVACASLLPSVWRAETKVDALGIASGDLIIAPNEYSPPSRPDVPGSPGRLTSIPRDGMRTLRDAIERGGLSHLTPWGVVGTLNVTNGHRWGRPGPDWIPRAWLWRAIDSRVSEPIRASSDDGAIFELVAQVGCRLGPVR